MKKMSTNEWNEFVRACRPVICAHEVVEDPEDRKLIREKIAEYFGDEKPISNGSRDENQPK